MDSSTISALTGSAALGLITSRLPTASSNPSDPVHFALLIFSVVVWLLTIFLLMEASRILKWIFVGEAGAPNPRAGVFFFPLLSLLIAAAWYLYRLSFFTSRMDASVPMMAKLFEAVLQYPLEFVPGFVIAAIPVMVVGSLKLVTILAAFSRKSASGKGTGSKQPLFIAMVYLLFQLLGASASAVALWRAFTAK